MRISMPGGLGSNNIAELQALVLAFREIIAIPLPARKIFIFSDSRYALDLASGASRPHMHLALAKLVRQLYRKASRKHDTSLEWSPGHVGILGNEEADLLAKTAAEENDVDTRPVAKFPHLILTYH
jgi:ribonuclease HI